MKPPTPLPPPKKKKKAAAALDCDSDRQPYPNPSLHRGSTPREFSKSRGRDEEAGALTTDPPAGRQCLVGSVGVLGTLQLHLEPLHADLKPVHRLDGCLCAGRVVETHKAWKSGEREKD